MRTLLFAFACSFFSMLSAECHPKVQDCCVGYDECCGIGCELYGGVLFLQPNGSDFYYAAEAIGLDESIAVPVASPNWNIKEIDPNYHPGFEIGACLLFRNVDMNLDLNWKRLHLHDSATYETSSASGYMVGPFFDIGPNSAAYKIANGMVKTQFDAVNLNFGKNIQFFNRLTLNICAGIDFVRIKQDLDANYSNVANTISRNVQTISQFIGAGPQVGLDYDCRLVNRLFFTGTTNISLFMGQMKNDNVFTSFTPELNTLGNPNPNIQRTNVPNRAQLVPGFVQKLGFSYLVEFKRAKLSLNVGYQCQIYVNAVQSVDMTAPQVLPTGATFDTQVGVFAVGFERTLSNYILTGPYASLNLEF